jgi:hypothetical protein
MVVLLAVSAPEKKSLIALKYRRLVVLTVDIALEQVN